MDSLYSDDSRFEVDVFIKNESAAASPRAASSTPIPSTETADLTPSSTRASPPKKKGTAATVKKIPKRPKSTLPRKPKKPKNGGGAAAADDGSGGDNDSDNGPYCLCQGPDDHRWMICCEGCDDWFHGECINLVKEVGENLIEKFICPRCTNKHLRSIYKRSCSMGACKKAARLNQSPPSYFCSPEHAQAWWERLVGRLPKAARGGGGSGVVTDQLSQDEFMALLSSGLATVDEHGHWAMTSSPFAASNGKGIITDDSTDSILSEEERSYVQQAAHTRRQLEAETLLCDKMLALIERAQERRRAAVAAGRFGDDMCGYDQRLDTISARDAFAAYAASPEGEAALATGGRLDDPLGDGDAARGMCERKRCKTHSGWQKALALGIRHQIREMAAQSEIEAAEERFVREAAAERWKRKQSEKNWVEVLEG
ncbi:PHD transcription [Cordyceps militaris]|uniref:PHD transcription n=1 Tax=Cordyceps militaris TaxID=73501 RepID=A0A2H4SMX4_CORMI|nr:PHD transcription [Cordyceps militaris]